MNTQKWNLRANLSYV